MSQGVELGRRRVSGWRALVAAGTALAGLVLAINPENLVARAMASALPVLGDAVPAVIAACATIVAAFSQPPRVR